MTALQRAAAAARERQRGRPGEGELAGTWVGRVYRIREQASESGFDAGLYITLPRLAGDRVFGPVPHLAAAAPLAVDDWVSVVGIEGRRDRLLVTGRIVWGPPEVAQG